jgi:phospholipase C
MGAVGALALPFRPASAQSEIESAAKTLPIRHVLVCVNENRSFDHYYGYAPFAGAYGVPLGYSQPNGLGGTVAPVPFYLPATPNPTHDWPTIHAEWDNGKMDGFYTANGVPAMLYYTQASLPFYYSLFQNFALCVRYHCSQLGPTFPNRLYTVGGTSGGITTNSLTVGSLNWPIIFDLLEAYGITWKVYGIEQPCSVSNTVGSQYCDNIFQLFERWHSDPRVTSYNE